MTSHRLGRTALLFVLWTAAALGDDADVAMLIPGEKVADTLSASGERKTVALAGIEGSTLDVTVKASKGSRVTPRLSILAPDGSTVDVGETNRAGTGKAQIKHLALGVTGVWRIGITTPTNAGGSFQLTTRAKVPLRFSWNAPLADAADEDVHEFPAAPCGSVTISVASKGKPAFDPTIELLAPSGEVLAQATGLKGKAKIEFPSLVDLGRYAVRVTGGPGQFAAQVAVRPARKRTLTYGDVESRPEIRGFTPTSAPNDSVVAFELQGFAFSTQQTVAVVEGVSTRAAAPVKLLTATGATADINLDDVPPGTYSLRVTTPEGNAAVAQGTLVVTNRVPGVASISPAEIGNQLPISLEVRGQGFDTTAQLLVRRSSDGTALPLALTGRTGHSVMTATLTPPPYETGLLDVEVRDPDGANRVVAGGIDLLGYRRAPVALRTYTASSAWINFITRDAVYDTTNGRVLLAIQEGLNVNTRRCVYVLFDPATLTVLDTLVIGNAEVAAPQSPRVAWSEHDGTFALTCVGTSMAYVRIVSADDLHDTISEGRFNGLSYQARAAAHRESGGYVVAWDAHFGNGDGYLKSQVVAPDGTIDTSTQTNVVSNTNGYIWEPNIVYQGNGRFVVAWIGATGDNTQYASYATVVDDAGRQTSDAGPYLTADNDFVLFQPELAVNPEDGSTLLIFTYDDTGGFFRPACQVLAPVSASPGPYLALDGDSRLPQGYVDSVVWNPERREFVVAMTTVESRVALRRVNPDGSMRPATVLDAYEGRWGILYSGPTAGTLGMVRGHDGVADGTPDRDTLSMQAVAAPLR